MKHETITREREREHLLREDSVVIEWKERALKAEAEAKLWQDRCTSIIWSGALDNFTGAEIQRWVADYKVNQNTLITRAEKAEDRLKWLERFLQGGGASINTVSSYQHEDHPDDTEDTEWNMPFHIGMSIETENRGCYEWMEFSNGAKGICPAIDAAKIKYAEWRKQFIE